MTVLDLRLRNFTVWDVFVPEFDWTGRSLFRIQKDGCRHSGTRTVRSVSSDNYRSVRDQFRASGNSPCMKALWIAEKTRTVPTKRRFPQRCEYLPASRINRIWNYFMHDGHLITHENQWRCCYCLAHHQCAQTPTWFLAGLFLPNMIPAASAVAERWRAGDSAPVKSGLSSIARRAWPYRWQAERRW